MSAPEIHSAPEIRFGIDELSSIFQGTEEISSIYLGTTLVYENGILYSSDNKALTDVNGIILAPHIDGN